MGCASPPLWTEWERVDVRSLCSVIRVTDFSMLKFFTFVHILCSFLMPCHAHSFGFFFHRSSYRKLDKGHFHSHWPYWTLGRLRFRERWIVWQLQAHPCAPHFSPSPFHPLLPLPFPLSSPLPFSLPKILRLHVLFCFARCCGCYCCHCRFVIVLL